MSLNSPLPALRDGLTPIQRGLLETLARRSRRGRGTVRASHLLESVVGEPTPWLEDLLQAGNAGFPPMVQESRTNPHLEGYLELTHLIQPFRARYPLVVGIGNFGSIDGDPPADPTFTQCRLSRFGAEVVAGNAPHLLVNGATSGRLDACGIQFLPHNLGDILEVAKALVQAPDLSDAALHSRVPGPDFPTGGAVIGISAVQEIYSKGEGVIQVRGKTRTETSGTRTIVIVEELPFCTSKSEVVRKTSESLGTERLQCVWDLLDESDENGIRLVFVLRPGVDPEGTVEELRRCTGLEREFRVTMMGDEDGVARRVSMAALLRAFVRRLAEGKAPEGGRGATREKLIGHLERLQEVHADARRTDLG